MAEKLADAKPIVECFNEAAEKIDATQRSNGQWNPFITGEKVNSAAFPKADFSAPNDGAVVVRAGRE
jgi:hypothetical protein